MGERAAELGLTPRDLACTLLLAVVGPTRAIFAQIGDGAIVVEDGLPGTYRPVLWPQAGEYANATYFVTDPEALRQLQWTVIEDRPVEEVALFTDGLQSLALRFHDRTAHSPFFEKLLGSVRLRSVEDLEILEAPLHNFLNSDAVNARTDDDKTLVLATRRSVPSAVTTAPSVGTSGADATAPVT